MTGTIAITMAGFGNRFRNAGYDLPKYQIEVLGRPLFDWSMLSLEEFRKAGWRFSFAIRAADGQSVFIRDRCAALGIKIGDLIELDEPTDGQATTGFVLAKLADPAVPFAIYNIDTFVRPGAMAPDDVPSNCQGWLPCFPGPGEGWSFARLANDGAVAEVREKNRISPHATVGFYWFATSALYLETYDVHFAGGNEEKGERYVAPMYNCMIEKGYRVDIAPLELADVGMLGTPEQVREFTISPPASVLEALLLTKA